MKEKTLFECELCHTQYAAKIDAQCCENNHKRVMSVVAERFLPEKQDASGYPIDVTLVMSDGQKLNTSAVDCGAKMDLEVQDD